MIVVLCVIGGLLFGLWCFYNFGPGSEWWGRHVKSWGEE